MYDSIDELLAKVRLGEDSTFEMKSLQFSGASARITGPGRDEFADELASFANTAEGVVLLGVDDKTKEVIGISSERLEAAETFVREVCNDNIKPALLARIVRMELPDSTGHLKAIIRIDIPKSLFVHESSHGYFHRIGSSKRKMTPDYLARLFQQRSQARLIRFEEQVVPGTSLDDLSDTLWRRYTTRSTEPAEVVLLKRNLLSREANGLIRCSVAGVLMCSERPDRFLPSAYIEAVHYRGTRQDSNYQSDAQRIVGPLDAQINEAMSFLKRRKTVSAVKSPHRVETPQFSERAVFEAIVNAVAHRDYSIAGSKIRFFIFGDRLEIYSPGALPNTVTIESMALRQATRNELITSLLAETPIAEAIGDVGRGFFMEKRGDGVPIILHESTKLSGQEPKYRLIDDSELLLTIWGARQDSASE
jgi:predicted HTH transcriptional regulator